jgi:hypothetical protein
MLHALTPKERRRHGASYNGQWNSTQSAFSSVRAISYLPFAICSSSLSSRYQLSAIGSSSNSFGSAIGYQP